MCLGSNGIAIAFLSNEEQTHLVRIYLACGLKLNLQSRDHGTSTQPSLLFLLDSLRDYRSNPFVFAPVGYTYIYACYNG